MTQVEYMMLVFNPSALIVYDDVAYEWVIIEDIVVPDDGAEFDLTFRVEYRANGDGTNVRAWLLFNPVWPIDDHDYHRTHLSQTGFICFGHNLNEHNSPYDLAYAVPRVRLWSGGYLHMQRYGYHATCLLIPGWSG